MADWKPQVNYNYNTSYHAYAYGLVYPGPQQGQGNLNSWGETGVMDLSNSNPGVTQAYYSATTDRTRDDPAPGSPEQLAASGHCQYPVYLGDTQTGRLLLSGPHQATYEARANEVRRAGSESASDSEAHTSPDLWSSDRSREGSLPQEDPTTWAEKELHDEASTSPEVGEDVYSSVMEDPQSFAVIGNENTNTTSLRLPLSAPKKPSTISVNNPKGKVRAVFSESQMNALVQRFTVQRYLTPAEMKNLAELTGLTYKQVKTWFQNRRMKLRRHQKEINWACERYTINKGGLIHGAMYSNVPSHFPTYQGEARPKDHYNQQMVEATFRKTAPQNLAFFLAAGSAGYPSWSSGASETTVPTRPQVAGWPIASGVGHFDCNPSAFNSAAANNAVHDMGFERKDGSLSAATAP